MTTTDGDTWLGLDLGTQGARALAVDATGRVVGQGSARLAGRRDGPRHEQDPREWWRALSSASRAALEDVPAGAVRGVALCATSGTILLVDDDGQPLTPGLMYDDARAPDDAGRAQEAGAQVWASLGLRIQPSWALPKLLWLVREHPDLPPGARLAHQPDFVTRRLVGHEVPSDASHALKTGYDLLHDAWPRDVLDELGVPGRLLPDVVRPGAELGTVCAAATDATGIPEGTPVIAGMTDGCAAQLGAGALSLGSWNSVLGTTLVLKGVADELVRDPGGVVYSHRSPDGNWLPGGASSTGAGVLSQRFGDRDLEELTARTAEREPTPVVAYPLTGKGERFPFTAPDAEGFVLGQPADEVEDFAAVLQGVAYVERLCFDYLDLLGAPIDGDHSLTGGGARSRYWCQLRADVLGHPVTLPENAEAALGMAVLAASPGRAPADVAARMVRVREVLEPRPARTEGLLQLYVRLVEELRSRGWVDDHVAHHARRRAGA
ncbi:FGGY-family carbohydrate kinase [soil metagenome]